MRRRQVLAGGTALLAVPLAGCGHPPNVLDMSEASDSDIANEAARSINPESDEYAIVAEAVANGSATASGTAPPIRASEPVSYEGKYYEIDVSELDSREQTRYSIEIDYNPGDVTPERGEIDYESLPAVDRQALDGLIPPREDVPTDGGYDMGQVDVYAGTTTNESVLVPTQQYDVVVHEGNRYRIAVEGNSVTETDFRYEVTEIANSTAAFADQIRSEYLFPLSGLSAEERDVVQTAIEDGYFEEANEPFRSVVARLLAHRAVKNGGPEAGHGTWLVEYDSTEYLTYAEYPTDITPRR